MKVFKILIVFLLNLVSVGLLAQTANTFPAAGNVGIGTTSPSNLLAISQASGSAKGILINGDEYFVSGNTSTKGFLMLLGVNRPGNKQLWLGDNSILGTNDSVGFFRFVTGSNVYPVLDLVNGTGTAELPFSIGGTSSNVGIGLGTFIHPTNKLTVNGNLAIGNGYLREMAPVNGAVIQGNVLIGRASQSNPSYNLDVAGNIRSNQIVVNTNGADFVFEPSYRLYPLSMLEKYIKDNHHLPELASASKMRSDGLNLGETQTKLLQKLEELTLYIIASDVQMNMKG